MQVSAKAQYPVRVNPLGHPVDHRDLVEVSARVHLLQWVDLGNNLLPRWVASLRRLLQVLVRALVDLAKHQQQEGSLRLLLLALVRINSKCPQKPPSQWELRHNLLGGQAVVLSVPNDRLVWRERRKYQL